MKIVAVTARLQDFANRIRSPPAARAHERTLNA
jgi:hypothetical protein